MFVVIRNVIHVILCDKMRNTYVRKTKRKSRILNQVKNLEEETSFCKERKTLIKIKKFKGKAGRNLWFCCDSSEVPTFMYTKYSADFMVLGFVKMNVRDVFICHYSCHTGVDLNHILPNTWHPNSQGLILFDYYVKKTKGQSAAKLISFYNKNIMYCG